MIRPWKPTRQQIEAASSQRVADVIGPGLRVLFVGINPGLYTAAVGCHFARPGNRFWPALHASGFTDRLLSPFEERELLRLGLGITNVVPRATATAAEISPAEFRSGGRRLRAKVRRYRPAFVVILGITAWRTAFGDPDAAIGEQRERFEGARAWVLPNPSGLNAHYGIQELGRRFRELRESVEIEERKRGAERKAQRASGTTPSPPGC